MGDLYQIKDMDIITEQIGIGNSIFLTNKNFKVDAHVDYDDDKKNVLIKPSNLKIGHFVRICCKW